MTSPNAHAVAAIRGCTLVIRVVAAYSDKRIAKYGKTLRSYRQAICLQGVELIGWTGMHLLIAYFYIFWESLSVIHISHSHRPRVQLAYTHCVCLTYTSRISGGQQG